MHSKHVVMMSAHAMYYDGHIRVTNATSVKSSKVGTMLLRDCHANLHVIAVQSLVSIGKRVSEQQVVEQICDVGNGPQGPKEAVGGDGWKEKPLQLTKQHCDSTGNAELQGEVN